MYRHLNRLALLATLALAASAAEWAPVPGHLMTHWGREADPHRVLPEYPRPQLRRERWANLNGLWDYAICPRDAARPEAWDGQILVPFCAESALSGLKKTVGGDMRLWYRRTFRIPRRWSSSRILLHFGAVDWEATVWVDGTELGRHLGGYDPFSFDITPALSDGRDHEVVVAVWDPTNRGFQPRGKQVVDPKGIWYTSVTGIWQTVWLEPVPSTRIAGAYAVADPATGSARIRVETVATQAGDTIRAEVRAGGTSVAEAGAVAGAVLAVTVPNPRAWSPDDPFLYDLALELVREGEVVDRVDSYFAMRTVSVAPDADGIPRILLNGTFLFQYGPLDQGWWPDGLYTAPTDAALRFDVAMTKSLGFNMIRKHVKVEPARWYYHCDRLGMLVWQDMPNGDRGSGRGRPDVKRSEESAENFETELARVIDAFRCFPSIVMWVPFNEGWGQYDTVRIANWVKDYDPSRLVNNASGWTDRGAGDVVDMHTYPGPGIPKADPERALVLGEFGGLGWPVDGHLWWNKRNWGYRTYQDAGTLGREYGRLVQRLRPLIGRGLSGAVYTQTTDVEGEVNGIMTYDRVLVKLPLSVREAHRELYLPPPVIRSLAATAEAGPQQWRYTTEDPGPGWAAPDFDDSGWKTGPAGFGTATTPNAIIGTVWNGSDIWIRRVVTLQSVPAGDVSLRLYHDEDARVFLNGVEAASLTGYVTTYVLEPLSAAGRDGLRAGRNVLAAHCRQTTGGQCIDIGLVEEIEQEPAE